MEFICHFVHNLFYFFIYIFKLVYLYVSLMRMFVNCRTMMTSGSSLTGRMSHCYWQSCQRQSSNAQLLGTVKKYIALKYCPVT